VPEVWDDYDGGVDPNVSDKPRFLGAIWRRPTPDQTASLTAHYRGRMGALRGVDDLFVRVIHALKRSHEYRNTVIIYTSDNGWILGEHRLHDPLTADGRAAGVKYVPYQGSSRVPLLIAGPGFPRGRKIRGVTVNTDIAPTIEQISGARARLPQDGISLLAVARRPSLLRNRAVLLETFKNPRNVNPYKAIRTSRYLYDVEQPEGPLAGGSALFDYRRDYWELQSVVSDARYANVKSALARALKKLVNCKGRGCRVTVAPPAPGR
jgi:arylsulfatase A-like enzyme